MKEKKPTKKFDTFIKALITYDKGFRVRRSIDKNELCLCVKLTKKDAKFMADGIS
jgi:hypothetical protein